MSELNNVDMSYLLDVEQGIANPRTQVRTGSTQVHGAPGTGPSASGARSIPSTYTGLAVDLASVLAGGLETVRPTLLYRDDGLALLYDQKVNFLQGDPESGKTWILKAAIHESLTTGKRAAFVDIDHNGVRSTLDHLLLLGTPVDLVTDRDHFRYFEPSDGGELLKIVDELKKWNPHLVGFDSMGEILPMLGYSSNDSDDFTDANRRVFMPLADRGSCIAVVDHLAKNTQSRAFGASGSAAKQRSPGGSVIRVTVVEEYAPGRGGASLLEVWKDRNGGLREYCPPGRNPAAGTFRLWPEPGEQVSWSIEPPTGHEKPSAQAAAENDAQILVDMGLDPHSTSYRQVKEKLNWGSDRARFALNCAKQMHLAPDTHSQVQGAGAPETSDPATGSGVESS